MKKIISLVLTFALIAVCLASCGTHEAASTLDALLATVKSGDFANSSVIADSPFGNEDDVMMKAMYKNFDYKVGEVTDNGDSADVAVTMTMTDIGAIFTNYMNEALANANDPNWDADDTRFIEMLEEDGVATKTFDITVLMEKADGAWTVAEDNEAFIDALTGGLFSSLSGLVE